MKKGQVTIFIVIGILIVSSVSLFFASRAGIIPGLGGGKSETNVNSFLSTCLEGEVRDAIDLILKNGGSTETGFSTTFLFEDEETSSEITYLCYNQNDYFPCINQNPVLFKFIQNEIYDYVFDEVQNCFYDLEANLDRQNFEVSGFGLKSFEIDLKPKQVVLQTNSEYTLTKSGETTIEKNFKIIVPSRLYGLTYVVQEVVNKDATMCDFDYRGHNLFYSEFEINKFSRIDDSSDVYTIQNLDSNEKFIFATRGCVIPPGL